MKYYLILFLTFSTFAYAENKCPSCDYMNSNENRYCINCAKEIRSMTEEEKEEINKKEMIDLKTKSQLSKSSIQIKPKAVFSYNFERCSRSGVRLFITAENISRYRIKYLLVKVSIKSTDSVNAPVTSKIVKLVDKWDNPLDFKQKVSKDLWFSYKYKTKSIRLFEDKNKELYGNDVKNRFSVTTEIIQIN